MFKLSELSHFGTGFWKAFASGNLGGKAGAALMSLLLGIGWAGLGTSLGATFQRARSPAEFEGFFGGF